MVKSHKLNINPEKIILKKWNEVNNSYSQCTLRELWENGFQNGQNLQEHNKHKLQKKYMNENDFYVKTEFFDEVWQAFWSDMSDVEIFILEP